jgi:hypothetical protein
MAVSTLCGNAQPVGRKRTGVTYARGGATTKQDGVNWNAFAAVGMIEFLESSWPLARILCASNTAGGFFDFVCPPAFLRFFLIDACHILP